MTDFHVFGTGTFSMHFSYSHHAMRSLSFESASVSCSRLGSRMADAGWPLFGLNAPREGRHLLRCSSVRRCGEAGGTEKLGTGAKCDRQHGLRQGDQSNFRAVPASETAPPQIVPCGCEISSRTIPGVQQVAKDRPCCPIEETKKREFQRQAHGQRGSARADKSLLRINRLRPVCERVKSPK